MNQKFKLGEHIYYIKVPENFDIENIRLITASRGMIESARIHTLVTPAGTNVHSIYYSMTGDNDHVAQRHIGYDKDEVTRDFFKKVKKRKEREILMIKQEMLKSITGIERSVKGEVVHDEYDYSDLKI